MAGRTHVRKQEGCDCRWERAERECTCMQQTRRHARPEPCLTHGNRTLNSGFSMHHVRSFSTQPVFPHSSGVPPGHVCVFFLRRLCPCVVLLRSEASRTAVVFHLGMGAYFVYAVTFPAQFLYTTKAPPQQWHCVFFLRSHGKMCDACSQVLPSA